VKRHMSEMSIESHSFAPFRGVVDAVEEAIDCNEVLRYLGYPSNTSPNRHVQRDLEQWIEAAAERATPRAVYMIAPVAKIGRRSLKLETPKPVEAFTGAIGEFLGASRYVAAFIATAGFGIEELASEKMRDGDPLAAMIVNAVGAERAEAAESVVVERLRERIRNEDLAPTLPYSPGYCGMALTEQRKLFALLGDETAGVTLTEDCLMRPLKSISGLIGLGPADEIKANGSPCERCELHSCAMRR